MIVSQKRSFFKTIYDAKIEIFILMMLVYSLGVRGIAKLFTQQRYQFRARNTRNIHYEYLSSARIEGIFEIGLALFFLLVLYFFVKGKRDLSKENVIVPISPAILLTILLLLLLSIISTLDAIAIFTGGIIFLNF